MGLVCENEWLCLDEKYQYLLAHEIMNDENENGTIRVLLSNDESALKREIHSHMSYC